MSPGVFYLHGESCLEFLFTPLLGWEGVCFNMSGLKLQWVRSCFTCSSAAPAAAASVGRGE